MTAYIITGHPVGPNPIMSADAEALRVLMWENSVGKTINITLQGADDTKIKAHGALK